MCGIAGFFDPERRCDPNDYAAIAGAMAGRLAHRGPDDDGVWTDPEAGIAFGFRRLSTLSKFDSITTLRVHLQIIEDTTRFISNRIHRRPSHRYQ